MAVRVTLVPLAKPDNEDGDEDTVPYPAGVTAVLISYVAVAVKYAVTVYTVEQFLGMVSLVVVEVVEDSVPLLFTDHEVNSYPVAGVAVKFT